jgi:murein DD-endopeptidase MepM/ murein hydrolase activator NlpD
MVGIMEKITYYSPHGDLRSYVKFKLRAIMQACANTYPVKIVCRSAAMSRLRKLRLSWFVAGVAFSFGCTSALVPIFDNNELIASIDEPELKASASLEEIVGAAPADVTPQIALEAPQLIAEEANKTVVAEEKAAKEASINYPQSLELKVSKGDTLVSLLSNAGVSKEDAKNTFDAVRTIFNPRKLDIGSVIKVKIDKNSEGEIIVSEFKLPMSAISTVELTRTKDDQFNIRKTNVPLTKKLARIGGTIDSSIYKTGADIGIPASMMNEIVNAYSYDVDFQRDVKKGDSIDVLFERMETTDGKVVGNGNLVFSELNLGNRDIKIYRYTDKNGNADFYNEKGESIRKALLRTPINGARITSAFGMRNHPISGYTKMHRGVDFGAPTGTPIYAAGDGVVETASVKNGYGKYLKISHNKKYASAYAHLSRFASGVSPGKKVKQGQIVAYVGMTGATTGPHLHYEILVNNEQVNPANVKFKTGNVLQGKELAGFRSNISKIEAKLASVNRGNAVAMLEEPNKQKPE